MFKDYDKYLSTSLKVYIFVLLCVFILKLVGLNYFGLAEDNKILLAINDFVTEHKIAKDIINLTTLTIQFYLYLCMVCNKRKLYVISFVVSLINLLLQIYLMINYKLDWIYYILSFSIMIIVPMFVMKKISIKRQLKYIILMSVYQLISYFIRSIGINGNYGNFIIDVLLNIDQILLLLITYNITFMKGEVKLCQELEVGYSLLKKIHLRKSLKQLQRNLRKFRKLPKEKKLSISIYIVLSIIWNTFTIILIVIIAKLNHTLIECLFIATSFWLSKHSFGKPFHLSSMIQCFVISNITYYVLNRITTPLGISIFVPILLGVGLSYCTSKLVKKKYKPLYKGIPEDVFEETILKVTDKNSIKYKICYDFYIKGKSDVSLSFEYNYSLAGIRKIKNRINDEIRGLN